MAYSKGKRREAAKLFELGYGCKSVATALGIGLKTASRWQYTYKALGKEALHVSSRKKYSYELKVQAARDVVESGTSKAEVMERYGIACLTPLERWCRLYREGGAEALLPKPCGRPPKKAGAEAFASREEELEARVRELELELEIQKRISALADEIERRSHRR